MGFAVVLVAALAKQVSGFNINLAVVHLVRAENGIKLILRF
jgi:hypothetical protein